MKKVLTLIFAFVCASAAARAQERAVAFTGATVITVSGQMITDGVLVVQRGKIVSVGPRASMKIPADAQVFDAKGKVIMPGLVDTHSHLRCTRACCGARFRCSFTVHRSENIVAALRLAKEFNIRMILDGAAESYLVVEQIKAAGVSVIVHPTMYRAGGETENLSLETAATLRHAGVPIALQSGFEGYVPKTRVVLFEAGVAAANGLTFDEALASVTIDAARLLGVEKRVGSIEVGKDADLALFDGDPFEYATHVVGVVVNGRVVSEERR